MNESREADAFSMYFFIPRNDTDYEQGDEIIPTSSVERLCRKW